jgi:hypothetical protein
MPSRDRLAPSRIASFRPCEEEMNGRQRCDALAGSMRFKRAA